MSKLKNKRKNSKIGKIIYNHIINNKREYLIITILFFIGLIIGVLFINYSDDNQIQEISTYLIDLFNNIKSLENVDLFNVFKESFLSNTIILILIWFGGTTIIGMPIVYGTIILKGFSIGYTISSIIISIGVGKGIIIALSLLLIHNLIFIPAMFATCASGVKLYQSIVKNKERKNIKFEILRHTIFCVFMMLLMLLASIIETYVSTNISMILLKNINF